MLSSTHAWRKLAVRRYLSPLADVPLRALDRQTIKKLYRDLADHGKVRGEGGLAITSVHRVHATLHAALEEAVRDRLIASNPADGAHRLPDRARAEIKAWDAEELARLLETCRSDELYPLLRTAAWTGCRRGELVALRSRDVDLEAGVLVIRCNAVKGPNEAVTEVPPKSARGRRAIDVDDVTLQVLVGHLRGSDGGGYAFAHPRTGERLHPDAVSTRFVRLVRESGVRRLTFHALRHTHATLLLANGVPLHVVSRRLGHASEAFTARRYAHVLPQQQRRRQPGRTHLP